MGDRGEILLDPGLGMVQNEARNDCISKRLAYRLAAMQRVEIDNCVRGHRLGSVHVQQHEY